MTISHQETARPLLTPGEILQLPQDESLIFLSGIPPIRARKLHYFRDRNFLKRCLPTPALKADREAGKTASHDWAGFIRAPHPALDRGWSELVTADGEPGGEAFRDRHVDAVSRGPIREDVPVLFEDRAEPASPEVDDDSTIIELPGGVRLS
jgi:type IV secretion system protein VirD4